MSENKQRIKQMLLENRGLITAKQVSACRIPRQRLTEMIDSHEIVRVGRGVYALPQVLEDEMFVLQYRFSRGIFSHETALYLHGVTDRTPHYFVMTFPQGYNTESVKQNGVNAKTAVARLYELGLTVIFSHAGQPLKAYNIERTLCDIIKSKSDIQFINQAMKAYANSKEKNISKLLTYADELRVKPKILTYLEVLL
ncbi:MAG: abortive phage infection protein [Clostridiales bacterium]|jgi:predicted transcriptional regulator of viral defense system|nr:abortive phage infection protein [Clostridiales bacterium]